MKDKLRDALQATKECEDAHGYTVIARTIVSTLGITRHHVDFLGVVHEDMADEGMAMSGFNDIADILTALLDLAEES